MLKEIHIYNEHGDVLKLPLGLFGETSEYIVKEVDGLGPVKANILTSSFVTMDGGVYQNASVGVRNIVLQLGFNPVFNSSDPYGRLRRQLYAFLSPKMRVEMRFILDDMDTVRVFGYVESNEPSIFTKDPEVQVSILCPDPNFSAMKPITVERDGEGILFVDNPGNVPVGFTLTLDKFSSSSTNSFVMTRTSPSSAKMSFLGSIYVQGELVALRVVTTKGSKSAKWMYSSAYDPKKSFVGTDVIGYMEGWMDLVPGINTLRIVVSMSVSPDAPITLSFTPKYSGL